MSDKYILRSGAIDAIKRGSGTLYTREAECLLQKAISLLKSAPAADVAPVVHGRKIEDGDIGCFWLCSLCGECLPYGASYCPNCGAKMDGGADHA